MTYPPVQIVDADDNVIGAMYFTQASAEGKIMRITRVILTNTKGEVLLQKRSQHVRVPGRWNESAAGVVDEDDGDYLTAAYREAKEELGVEIAQLSEAAHFYREEAIDGQLLKRFHTVFTGQHEGPFNPDAHEVAELKWVSPADLQAWVERAPDDFLPSTITALANTGIIKA